MYVCKSYTIFLLVIKSYIHIYNNSIFILQYPCISLISLFRVDSIFDEKNILKHFYKKKPYLQKKRSEKEKEIFKL